MSSVKKKGSKKSSKKSSASATVGWADAMKLALEKKGSRGGGPQQPKPRDSAVKKLKKSSY